jgi:hypothetical protein
VDRQTVIGSDAHQRVLLTSSGEVLNSRLSFGSRLLIAIWSSAPAAGVGYQRGQLGARRVRRSRMSDREVTFR